MKGFVVAALALFMVLETTVASPATQGQPVVLGEMANIDSENSADDALRVLLEDENAEEADVRTLLNGGDFGTNIVGGVESSDERFKFTVSLQRKVYNGYKHFCGGSLIHESYVITAGHCVKYSGPDRVEIGNFKVSTSSKFNAQHRKVKGVIRHPQYVGVTNDIAILKLETPCKGCPTVQLSQKVNQVPQEKNGQMLTVVGWGYTKEGNGLVEDNMREVNVPIVDLNTCSKSYGTLDESKICAGYSGGKKDSCSGDSGGPLFYDDGKDIVQVGLVSYGRGCARAKYYGVYARASYFIDFVKDSLWKDGKVRLPVAHSGPTGSPTPSPSKAPTSEDFSNLLKVCVKKKSKKACDKSKTICMWNNQGGAVNPDFKANSCIPLSNDSGSEDGDDNQTPTPHPTSSSLPGEMTFCNKQRKYKNCKKVLSRCFWNDKGDKTPIVDGYKVTCQPRELLDQLENNSEPTQAPTPDAALAEAVADEREWCGKQRKKSCNRVKYGKNADADLKGKRRCFYNNNVCESMMCHENNDSYDPNLCD